MLYSDGIGKWARYKSKAGLKMKNGESNFTGLESKVIIIQHYLGIFGTQHTYNPYLDLVLLLSKWAK